MARLIIFRCSFLFNCARNPVRFSYKLAFVAFSSGVPLVEWSASSCSESCCSSCSPSLGAESWEGLRVEESLSDSSGPFPSSDKVVVAREVGVAGSLIRLAGWMYPRNLILIFLRFCVATGWSEILKYLFYCNWNSDVCLRLCVHKRKRFRFFGRNRDLFSRLGQSARRDLLSFFFLPHRCLYRSMNFFSPLL